MAAPTRRPARGLPDAEAARARLEDGSRSIRALLDSLAEGTGTAHHVIAVDPRDLGIAPDAQGAPRQRPYAAVLGCSDARVPIELIFNEGPNDLFVVRVAGNGLGSEVLGSLKYAVDHLGGSLKLIVVLGHSGCGAVSAAVDAYLDPQSYLALAAKHSLRSILDRLLIVVSAAAMRMTAAFGPEVVRRPGYRAALIEVAVVSNAALAAYTLQQEIGAADSNGCAPPMASTCSRAGTSGRREPEAANAQGSPIRLPTLRHSVTSGMPSSAPIALRACSTGSPCRKACAPGVTVSRGPSNARPTRPVPAYRESGPARVPRGGYSAFRIAQSSKLSSVSSAGRRCSGNVLRRFSSIARIRRATCRLSAPQARISLQAIWT